MSYIVTWKVVKHMSVQKKHDPSINPVAAAVTGVVVGAGVAIAGVVAMKDEKNSKVVRDIIDTVKDKAAEYMEQTHNKTQSTQYDVQNRVTDGKKAVKKAAQKIEKAM